MAREKEEPFHIPYHVCTMLRVRVSLSTKAGGKIWCDVKESCSEACSDVGSVSVGTSFTMWLSLIKLWMASSIWAACGWHEARRDVTMNRESTPFDFKPSA